MKKLLLFSGGVLLVGAALLGAVLAQPSGFTVIRTPGLANQIATTSITPQAAQLRVRCVGNLPEVVVDPKIALPTTQPPLFVWSFDVGKLSQSRFDFVPESGELLLPATRTVEFLRGLADSSRLKMRLTDPKEPIWEADFSVTGFRAVFAALPCNQGQFSQPSTSVAQPAPRQILDATVAFVSPLEFSQVFGGRFAPEAKGLIWEYGGKRLLLERGSKSVQDTVSNARLELPRPVQIVASRVVVPVRVVSAFGCSVAQTRPADMLVRVTCGAGATRMERELQRY
jgi:hypothetical protein